MVNKTRHLKLPAMQSFRLTRNVLVLSLFAVLGVGFVGGTAWQAWQNHQYRQAVSRQQASVQQLLDSSKNDLETKTDLPATINTMQNVADQMNQIAAQAPSEPRFLGIFQLGTESEAKHQATLIAAAHAYADDLRQAASFLTYQQSVQMALEPLAAKSAQNLDQLNELVNAWKTARETVKATAPPAQAQTAHTALTGKLDTLVSHLEKLPDLYKKIDISGFAAAKKDVNTAIDDLHSLAESYKALAHSYDTRLVTDRAQFQ